MMGGDEGTLCVRKFRFLLNHVRADIYYIQ